jgi:hypothetical protein
MMLIWYQTMEITTVDEDQQRQNCPVNELFQLIPTVECLANDEYVFSLRDICCTLHAPAMNN